MAAKVVSMRMRTMGAILGSAGLVFLAAACGGSPSAATTTSTGNGAVAFAACMRSHGVPNWPDPTSSGTFDKTKLTPQQLGASVAKVAAAQSACGHLLPGGGAPPSAAQLQQVKELGLKFAECVRAHGVAGFPDPGSDGRIPDPATAGIDQGSPKFKAANDACAKWRPPYMPSNAAYDAYARTHGG
jgi:hypothetical protein